MRPHKANTAAVPAAGTFILKESGAATRPLNTENRQYASNMSGKIAQLWLNAATSLLQKAVN